MNVVDRVFRMGIGRWFGAASLLAASFVVAGESQAQLGLHSRGGFLAVNDLRGDYTAAGVGLRGTGGSGTITISDIPQGAVVKEGILYWNLLLNESQLPADTRITFNGHALHGEALGANSSPCQAIERSVTCSVDVTPWVTGNGTYAITNVPDSGSVNVAPVCEGCTLVVVYSHLDSIDRDIVFFYGAERVTGPPNCTQSFFTRFNVSNPVVSGKVTCVVADGDPALTETIDFSGTFLGTNPFDGSDSPGIGYWDTDTFDVTSALFPGQTTVVQTICQGQTNPDCFVHVANELSVSSTLPAVDVVSDLLTPTVSPGGQLSIRFTVTNNTATEQPILVTMNAYDAFGRLLGNAFTNRPGGLRA
ncbi:MAG: DUF3344 domain-containing protein, partial [Planctomycetes bacterium]|nr:DUF3344 domain-containing protein [Planctomycetota bacterium]